MDLSLIESLNVIGNELNLLTSTLCESITTLPAGERAQLFESASTVLSTLVTKLKSHNMSDADNTAFAQLYVSLSLLAQDAVRQGFNIDLSTPQGKTKFINIIDNVGDNPRLTAQVQRIASVSGQSKYNQVLKDFETFYQKSPAEQQDYIQSINKLRIAYERASDRFAKEAMTNFPKEEPAAPPAQPPIPPEAFAHL